MDAGSREMRLVLNRVWVVGIPKQQPSRNGGGNNARCSSNYIETMMCLGTGAEPHVGNLLRATTTQQNSTMTLPWTSAPWFVMFIPTPTSAATLPYQSVYTALVSTTNIELFRRKYIPMVDSPRWQKCRQLTHANLSGRAKPAGICQAGKYQPKMVRWVSKARRSIWRTSPDLSDIQQTQPILASRPKQDQFHEFWLDKRKFLFALPLLTLIISAIFPHFLNCKNVRLRITFLFSCLHMLYSYLDEDYKVLELRAIIPHRIDLSHFLAAVLVFGELLIKSWGLTPFKHAVLIQTNVSGSLACDTMVQTMSFV